MRGSPGANPEGVNMQKKIVSVHQARAPHMVGDGLPVRNVFSYRDLGKKELSPFLMLDYGSPSQFPPTDKALGVGMHPHRGFETVTIAFQGQLEHRDTAGNHGEIGPGDVQWMTAGSGVLHEEMHAPAFRKSGGTLQMAQLWVNLPAALKMSPPKYQTLLKEDIPVIEANDCHATVRVIAGQWGNAKGPASTHTPVTLLDVKLTGGKLNVDIENGHTTALFMLDGSATINGDRQINALELAVLSQDGSNFTVEAVSELSHFLVMSGAPIDEPVVGYGPFVMNTEDEIMTALKDFANGRY